MRTKIHKGIACISLTSFFLTGCSGTAIPMTNSTSSTKTSPAYTKTTSGPVVPLKIWGAREDKDVLKKIVSDFQNKYSDTTFKITIEYVSESNCKDRLSKNVHDAADVFTFADDQLQTLVASGIIGPVTDYADITERNSVSSTTAASIKDTLYAYPLTADNGYFLYYNKKYFKEKDIKSLDKILKICKKKHKYVSMDLTSGWYLYSFYGNTGLKLGLNKNGLSNFCNWNTTAGKIKGTDVAKSMIDIAKHDGFKSNTDTQFVLGVENESIIAGISGIWNANTIQMKWGKNFGATKLPTYTCHGKQIQMASYIGYKLVGVNQYSTQKRWAEKFANWMTNEENQTLRFKLRGQNPTNLNAKEDPEIINSRPIKALTAQARYASLQRVGPYYWAAIGSFGKDISEGKITKYKLQDTLDDLVKRITLSYSYEN